MRKLALFLTLLPLLVSTQTLSADAGQTPSATQNTASNSEEQAIWQRMEQAHWLLDGKKDAPRIIYLFTDPFCPYCRQFWQQSRPWIDSGKVQIRTLLVGVIKPDSPATAAAILSSMDPAKTWRDYEQSSGKIVPEVSRLIAPDKLKILNDNKKILIDLGAAVTPAIYYMNDAKQLQQVVGLPDSASLHAMMGSD
ncbi:thiol:disulfide interchange protein DsbG [[Enterobacter] lignolyticus]|uniref:Thiol:disulfide interchange protein n=1 Tax=[Enterobacter] lignolyticus TaxID=1334193 RepID=A0A806X327_9ENTR|nr:hypothetical protein AO703_06360 [[Enterobacter] lignolyticus]